MSIPKNQTGADKVAEAEAERTTTKATLGWGHRLQIAGEEGSSTSTSWLDNAQISI
jgi:hypothetical protein